MGYSMLNVDEIEGAGPGGAVQFVRRVLGVEAFGVNWFELAAEHRRARARRDASTGRRRCNVIVARIGRLPHRRRGSAGRGVGTFMRFDPGTTRQPVAGPDGMAMIGIGARRGSYEPRGPF